GNALPPQPLFAPATSIIFGRHIFQAEAEAADLLQIKLSLIHSRFNELWSLIFQGSDTILRMGTSKYLTPVG
ncbi:hypothetical protein H0H93_008205, partial [Arthromyces matolae]